MYLALTLQFHHFPFKTFRMLGCTLISSLSFSLSPTVGIGPLWLYILPPFDFSRSRRSINYPGAVRLTTDCVLLFAATVFVHDWVTEVDRLRKESNQRSSGPNDTTLSTWLLPVTLHSSAGHRNWAFHVISWYIHWHTTEYDLTGTNNLA